MCGICGIFSKNPENKKTLSNVVLDMAVRLSHRGPDETGCWVNKNNIVGFGHTRLSIIDLSPAGSQPMSSAQGDLTIVFNGEIYNHKILSRKLQKDGIRLRGHSDTEVLLEYIDAYGLVNAIQDIEGMFALAIWDSKKSELSLVRDRFGEKPLYYGMVNGSLYFTSELKALKAVKEFHPDIDHDSLALYLKYNYVPTPRCIFAGFKKLVPGCYVSGHSPEQLMDCVPVSFWSPNIGQVRSATQEDFSQRLLSVVENQIISDVPIGCFLSGGLDSTAIAATMQDLSSSPISTFTIGFEQSEYDESRYAREIACYLGTKHTELKVTNTDLRDLVPSLPAIFDEPFADSSQLPTTILSRLAADSVKVCLSGDGGDELCGGYHRYGWVDKYLNLSKCIPHFTVPVLSKLAKILEQICPPVHYQGLDIGTSAKIHQIVHLISLSKFTNAVELIYDFSISHSNWKNPADILIPRKEFTAESFNQVSGKLHGNLPMYEQLMLYDSQSYLIDDIMTKVDRAAMFSSLETRAPFLDHRLHDIAWNMPLDEKVSDSKTKLPIRRVLEGRVPQELIDRPKKGFGVPLAQWLKSDMRDWSIDLLSPQRLKHQGLFDFEVLNDYLAAHLSGHANQKNRLWNVLVFQAWYDDWQLSK